MADAPRVLIASRLFAPEVSAGAFRLRALARGFVHRGCRVRVVTTTPPPTAPATTVEERGIEVSRFPVLRDRGGNVRGYVQYLSFDIPLFFRLLFARYDVAVAEAPPTTGLVVSVVKQLLGMVECVDARSATVQVRRRQPCRAPLSVTVIGRNCLLPAIRTALRW